MSAQQPNHVHWRHGEYSSYAPFGNACSVQLIHVTTSNGHAPHFAAHFGGVDMDLTPVALINFIRAGEAALAKLPRKFQHVADNVGWDE